MRTDKLLLNVIFIIMFFVICCSALAEKYRYDDEPMKQREELENEKKMSAIGKKYWVYPKPGAMARIRFFDAPSFISRKFSVSEKTSFEVQEFAWGKYHEEYFKIMFDDGRVAFIETSDLVYRVDHNPTIYRFTAREFESIYEEDTDVIRARLAAEDAKRSAEQRKKVKKAAAERKARGGVVLGMTKEQVLRSNWGKPSSKNRTIVKGLVREQWVYDGGYLYFENDILTAIQN